ncbi:MAG: hypothetical protein ACI32Z_07945 [Clostridium sp.]
MKKLIDLFNKKYGSLYGVIDDSIDNEDVYKVYKVIKTLCADDEEIMTLLEKVKLPNPKTAKESIEKININVAGGLSKEYVDEMSPFYMKLNEPLYENIQMTYNEDSEIYDLDIAEVNFDEISLYSAYITRSNGDIIFLSHDKLDSVYDQGIVFKDDENNIIDFEIYTNSYTNHLPKICAYDNNWNEITDFVSVTFNKIRFNNINDKYIDDLNFNKLTNVPYLITSIIEGSHKTFPYTDFYKLTYNLPDNLIIDKLKINESPYPTANKTNIVRADWSNFGRVYTKYSEGIEKASGYKLDKLKKGYYYLNGWSNFDKYYIDIVGSKNNVNTVLKSLVSGTPSYTLTSFNVPEDDMDVYILYRIPDEVNRSDISLPITVFGSGTKDLSKLIQRDNTIEYTPTGDYNPATKKYVDEKTASLDFTINNNLPVNSALTLTTSKFQTTTLATDTEVILPTVEGYTEIHLFFLGVSGTNVSDTNVAWNSKPTIEDNKKYEFIYTYVNSEIGWLGKAVVYTV